MKIKWGKLKRSKARIERMKKLRASDKTWTGELIEREESEREKCGIELVEQVFERQKGRVCEADRLVKQINSGGKKKWEADRVKDRKSEIRWKGLSVPPS